jgi:uncharacterized protein (DUF1778 family)
MELTERLEIRLSPAEKNLIELAAQRNNLSVSEYVRMCCLANALPEEKPEAIRRMVQAGAQEFIAMFANLRAATFRADENRKRGERIVGRRRT